MNLTTNVMLRPRGIQSDEKKKWDNLGIGRTEPCNFIRRPQVETGNKFLFFVFLLISGY